MRRWITIAGLLVALGAGVWIRPLFAGGHEEELGWLVRFDGESRYFDDEDWDATPNANGITLRNDEDGIEIFFYGNIRVDHRFRKVK